MLRACFAVLCSSVGVAAAIAACSGDSTTTSVTAVNGVLIRSASLVAGHGCGLGDSQVFKYVAVVSYDHDASPDPNLFASTFDCFTDGVFPNLLASSTGSLAFNVDIYAFNASSYNANAPAIANAIANANASPYPSPAGALGAVATWTTTCTAAQQANIQVLAVCRPLSPVSRPTVDAGADAETTLQIPTQSFASAEAGAFQCGTDFAQVSALWRDDRDAGPASNGSALPVNCPDPLVIHAQPNVGYAIDVLLLQPSDGGARGIATARCTATAKAGVAVVPSCAPAQSP